MSPVLVFFSEGLLSFYVISEDGVVCLNSISMIGAFAIKSLEINRVNYSNYISDPTLILTLDNDTSIMKQICKDENDYFSITSEKIALPESREQVFVLTGIEVLYYLLDIVSSDIDLFLYNGFDNSLIDITFKSEDNGRLVYSLDNPVNYPYVCYQINATDVAVKNVSLLGYLTEINE